MRLVSGGHAIMLSLEMPKDVLDLADKWISEYPMTRSLPKHPGHTTLVFIGRDLPSEVGEQMIKVTEREINKMPRIVTMRGSLAMFGANRNHLVAMLLHDHGLTDARRVLISGIDWVAKIDNSTNFNPHVTLAVSEANAPRMTTSLRKYELKVKSVDVKIGDQIETIRKFL